MKDESKSADPNKGLHSPSGREQTIANSGGMPPTQDCKEIWAENTPPDRMARDSTKGVGKP